MSERIVKINKHLQKVFGEILHEQADRPADVMVTISKVETAPNLKSATVWLYVFPIEQGEAVLTHLKNQMYDLQGAMNRELDMRPLPRLMLRLDHGAQHAESIEKKLASLE
jgi:ribosome-binding factor A